jgi:hypothetical protein
MNTMIGAHAAVPRYNAVPDQLAWDLEAGGFDAHEASIRQVVRAARAGSVSPVLVDILADPTEPEVARLRAFGRVAAALAATPLATRDHVQDTAA